MSAALSQPASAARRITRGDLITIGQAGSPWAFLPLALRALDLAPDDAEMRFLAAANWARLGLRTPAVEHLDRLPAADARVAALRHAAAGLPSDRLSVDDLLVTLRANLDTLTARGEAPLDLWSHVPAWRTHAAARDWFLARDGSVLRRCRGKDGGKTSAWLNLADHRTEAARFELERPAPGEPAPPIVLEGADPPWLFRAVVARTAAPTDGYAPRVTLLQADPLELLDGLAQTDLRAELALARVRVLVGADATERFARELATPERRDTLVLGPVVTLPTVRTRLDPAPETVVTAAAQAQVAESRGLRDRVARVYAGRDAAWAAARLRSGAEAGRVLLPVSRYSTFVRHSADDLAAAFERHGWRARILREPDAHSQLSGLAYRRAVAEFEPDLVVAINYGRAHFGDLFPTALPIVTWVQDAMPHLFTPAAGVAQGELDFLVGHTHAEFFSQCGYPAARRMYTPVLASDAKFHAGPVDADLAAPYRCDIAYVGHQSETAEAFRDRAVREARAAGNTAPETARLMAALCERAVAIARGPAAGQTAAAIRAATADAFREVVRREPTPAETTRLVNSATTPMADRAYRHQAIGWAAAIAARRGLRMHVYGRGWDAHPDLAHLARGPVPHGEELRACYGAASVHLHASISTIYHQRVFECFLSGGLALPRLRHEDLWPIQVCTLAALLDYGTPWYSRPDSRNLGFRVADNPEALALTALQQRTGAPAVSAFEIAARHVAERATNPWSLTGGTPIEKDAAWVFGDLAEIGFASEAELEARVLRAIERPAWKSNLIEGISGRVRRHYTHAAMVPRLLDAMVAAYRSPAGGPGEG